MKETNEGVVVWDPPKNVWSQTGKNAEERKLELIGGAFDNTYLIVDQGDAEHWQETMEQARTDTPIDTSAYQESPGSCYTNWLWRQPQPHFLRGWGEISWDDYGDYLEHLEDLSQQITEEQNCHLYLPVYACGYNWTASNADSAETLKQRMQSAIDEMKALNFICEKVIIISHSMGGFVSRYCSEVLKQNEKIAGIFHVAMPDNGSPATYKRMKSGFEGIRLSAGGYLGNDGEKVTAVLGHAPGGLELLPNQHYRDTDGVQGRWLQLEQETDDSENPQLTLIGDVTEPYAGVYTQIDPWWRLVTPEWLVPGFGDSEEERIIEGEDVFKRQFKPLITDTVKPFHDKLQEQKHAFTFMLNNTSNNTLCYDRITWESDESVQDRTPEQVIADDTYEDTNERKIILDDRWVNDEVEIADPTAGGDGTVHAGVVIHTKHCFKRLSIDTDDEHQGMMSSQQVMDVSDIFIRAALKNYPASKVELKNWSSVHDMLAQVDGVTVNPNTEYRIRQGDTLSEIALQYNVTVDQIMQLNPGIKDKHKIYPGNTIRLR